MKNAKLLVIALIVAAILSVSAVGAAEISLNATSSDPTQVPHEQVVSVAEPTSVQEVETIDLESSDDKGIDINNEIKLDSDELRSTNFKESLSRNDDSILGVSFDEEDNKIDSNVFNSSGNTLLKANVNGNRFTDIQTTINNAGKGETIYLDGKYYYNSGTGQIEIKRDIIIDGGSFNNTQVSVLDAKGLSRIFYSSGKYNITLRNLVFENAFYDGNGHFAYFAGGNINIKNLTIQNQNIAGNTFSNGIYIGAGSNLNASDVIFSDNLISSSKAIAGVLFYIRESSNLTINNLNVNYNNIASSGNINGLIYVRNNSRMNIDEVNFENNELNGNNTYGSFLRAPGEGFELLLQNLNVNNNRIQFRGNISGGFINSGSKSNVKLINLKFNYNNLSGFKIRGGFFSSGGNSTVLLVNSSNYNNYFIANDTINIAGYVVNGPSDYTIKNFSFVNNYVESVYDKVISTGFNLNGFSSFNVDTVLFMNNKVIAPYNSTNMTDPNDQGYGGLFRVAGRGIVSNVLCEDNFVSKAFGGCVQLVPRFDDDPIILENSTFINTTLGASDVNLNRFHHHDHGGVICVNDGDSGFAIIRNTKFIDNCNSLGGAICPHNHCLIDNCSFINNTATKFYGGAISTNLERLKYNTTSNATISIFNCYFEGNKAPIGGAIQAMGSEIRIDNCTFVNNSAVKGGAVFLQGDTIELHNCNFTDNHATDNLTNVIIKVQDWLVPDWDVDGGAIFIYGSNSSLYNNTFRYNIASGNQSEGCGGAIYVFGNNTDIEKSHFDDNFAYGGNGSAVYVHGSNTKIMTSEFFNHSSAFGTVYVIGDYTDILDSQFEHNVASINGGAIYSEGNYGLMYNNYFNDNNASVHGGAVHIHGDYLEISNSEFISNHAIPDPKDITQGLGGAIYIIGNNNNITLSYFDRNTARNGSAIYNKGENVYITDGKFLENQAFSYRLITTATPEVSYYNGSNQVLINVVLVGGDNIINAIYNDGSPKNMYFINVTYEHSTGNKTTPEYEVNPVDGAEKSDGGRLLYQDSREDYQNVTLKVVRDQNGLLTAPNSAANSDVIIEGTYKTGLYGNISLLIDDKLSVGKYSVYSEHPEDRLYKQISNETLFKIIPQTDLEVIKVVSNHTPKYGDVIAWTVTVINHGPNDAEGVYVDDLLPYGLSYVSDDSNGAYVNGKWNIGDLKVGGEAVINIKTIVDIVESTITNVAVVNSTTYDYNESNNKDNDTITVGPSCDLEITKIVNNSNPKKDEIVTWTIIVYNHGPSRATDVYVMDLLPEGVTYLSDDSGGDYKNGVWNIGNMERHSEAVIKIETLVTISNATITNVAVVNSTTPDNNESNNKDNDTINVDPVTDLAIEKIVSNHTPKMGNIIMWTVTVTNNGPDTAVNAVMRDVLPDGLIFLGSDGNYANGVWNIGDLANGSSATLKIWTQVNVTAAVITNVANVTSDTPESDLTNNNDSATIDVGHEADLEVIKIVSNHTPNKGDNITWTVTVINHGPDTAVDVIVNDVLPKGLIYIKDDSNGRYRNNVWTIGTLENEENVTLVITTQVGISNANITNVAVVTSDTYDPNETNNEDNDTIEVNPIVDLAIVKSVNNHTPKMGDNITWTIFVINHGPDTAVNVVMSDVLPDGLIFLGCDGNYANNVWNIGDLANGSSVTLKIWTQVNVTATVITNVANVTSDTPDSDLTNNNDSATIDIDHEADLEVIKIASNHTPNKGDNITWTVTVTNNGPDTAVDVIVTDVLPAGLIYIKDDSNGKYKNNVWTIGTLENKETVTLVITTEVAISNANITNVAVVTSDTYDPNETNNEDNDTIEVSPMADLEVIKVVSNHEPRNGDEITWTITVVNHGPDDAVNVVVSDDLPAGLIYVSDDSEGAYDSKTGLWNVGDLHRGRGLVLNIVTKVGVSNTNITNVAVVTSDTYDPNETNNLILMILMRPIMRIMILLKLSL